MRTSKCRILLSFHAMILLLVVTGLLATALISSANSIDVFQVEPDQATTNSRRWIRLECTVDNNWWISSAYINYGTAGNAPGYTSGDVSVFYPQEPDTVIYGYQHGSPADFILGPLCGHRNAFDQYPADYPYVYGYLWSPGSSTHYEDNGLAHGIRVTVVFVSENDVEVLSRSNSYHTVHDNDDLLEWFVDDGTGKLIDPVNADQREILDDTGTGSSTYTFRVRYKSGLYSHLNLPPEWHGPLPPQGQSGATSDRYHEYGIFGRTTDSWLDQIGYDRHEYDQRGATEPRILLLIDGQYWRPHYMIPEDPNDTDYTDGAIFRYTIRPTDYLNLADNMFLFPFDLPGQDPWDEWAVRLTGTPASNNYVAFAAGKHTYEFWATDDYAPPANRVWGQIGWPGNDLHVEYLERTAPFPQHTNGLRSAVDRSRTSLYRDQHGQGPYPIDSLRRFQDTSLNQPDPYGYTTRSHDCTNNADLPADLNELAGPATGLRNFPHVDPVLTAHPFFGLEYRQGGITWELPPGHADPPLPTDFAVASGSQWVAGGYEDNDFPNNEYVPGGVIGANPNPFAPEQGAGPGPLSTPQGPWKYTNDDTILPNIANIWDALAPTPYKGGKWTEKTKFTFRVNYWHSQNRPPRLMRIYIRRNQPGQQPGQWFVYNMQKAASADGDYTNGEVYEYEATVGQLPTETASIGGGIGNYNYYFVAGDGTRRTRFPDRPDPYTCWYQPSFSGYHDLGNYQQAAVNDPGDIGVPVGAQEGQDYYWFRVNNLPVLTTASVTPPIGRPAEEFTFDVTYTDPDGLAASTAPRGDRPFIAHVYVDTYGDRYGAHTVDADPAINDELDYTNGGPNDHADHELVGGYVVMQDGAAAGEIYRIIDNTGGSLSGTLALAPADDPDQPGAVVADGVAAGDHFYVARRASMEKQDTSDDDYTDGVVYTFTTGEEMTLERGQHKYFFMFADDWGSWQYPDDPDVRVEGQYVRYPREGAFEGPEVVENTEPQLIDYRFTPQQRTGKDGSTSVPFVLYVTYKDAENEAPAFVRMKLDTPSGTDEINVYPVDPDDNVYSDGATYRSEELMLAQGRHFVRAQASDGDKHFPPPETYTAGLPYMGPVATAQSVNGTTVTYTLKSGSAPFAAGRFDGAGIQIMALDGSMTQYAIESNAVNSGVGELTLASSPSAALSGEDFIFGAAPGPNVAANKPPILLLPEDDSGDVPGLEPDNGVPEDPASGTEATTFTYTIIYKDEDVYPGIRGNPPEYVQVYIDNQPYDMQQVDPEDEDYSDGATFQLQVPSGSIPALAAGTHTYFFAASDGLATARKPQAGTTPDRYTGPVVDGRPDPPKTLFVEDVAGDNGEAISFNFNASLDDGGGANDVTEYHLYRNTSGEPFADPPIIVIPADGSSAYGDTDPPATQDTGLQKATDYFYMVRAYDGASIDGDGDMLPDEGATIDALDQSLNSNVEGPIQALDNISPQPPENVNAADLGNGTIQVTWDNSPDDGENADDVVEYRLYRSTDPATLGTGQPLATIPANDDDSYSYDDDTPTLGTDYYYGVKAWDGANSSTLAQATPAPISASDGEAPQITNLAPADGATDVPPDTNIAFDVEDAGSGVDTTSITIDVTVRGDTTSVPNDELDITGSGSLVSVLYDPPTDFPYLTSVDVHVEVKDQFGNEGTYDYSFTTSGPPTQEIVGTITAAAGSGVDVSGITVRAYRQDGPGVLSATTDGEGNYTIDGLADGTYVVRPEKTDVAFIPAQSSPLTVPPSPQRADFTATQGYDISGTILDGAGDPMQGVRVSNGLEEVTTDGSGDYLFADVAPNQYTIVAQFDGYEFDPDEQTVDVVDADITDVDFTGSVEQHSVSGIIKTAAGDRLGSVQVNAYDQDDNLAGSDTTSANGAYLIENLPVASYTIIPEDPDWVFDPQASDIYVGQDVSDVNFTASPLHRYQLPAGLHMMAIPLTPRNLDPVAALPDGVAVPGDVRIARWDPTMATPDYRQAPQDPLPAQFRLLPGRSFWMNNLTGGSISLQLVGDPVGTNIDFNLSIERGWTMAGNMFEAALPWGNLSIAPGDAVRDYGFIYQSATGDYQLVTDLVGLGTTSIVPLHRGFWIKSDAKQTVLVAPATTTDVAEQQPSVDLSDDEYLIPISVRAEGRADTASVAGTVQGADDDYRIDNPPAVSPYVDLYFTGDDGRRLACDVRSQIADSLAWDFTVATDMPGATVELSLPDLSSVPRDKTVTLVDQATGKELYARTLRAYTYEADDSGTRQFTLKVAPKTDAGLVVSSATAQQAGAGAAITYSLSKAADVDVTVMNISGRVIRRLAGSGAAEKGVNTVSWNLRSQSGTRVPAGRYLVRVEAVAENGQVAATVTSLQIRR